VWAFLAPLLVAEPVIPAIHTGYGLLEKTFKLLPEDVRRCCAYKLLGDAAGGVLFRGLAWAMRRSMKVLEVVEPLLSL
jgi:hypothetical protein